MSKFDLVALTNCQSYIASPIRESSRKEWKSSGVDSHIREMNEAVDSLRSFIS